MDGSSTAVLADEETTWQEFRDLVASFTADAASESGYFAEGWSAKDALAHVGAWLAEAGAALEQIRAGTYERPPRGAEIDEMNTRFLEALRDVPLNEIQAHAAAARTRMRRAWLELDEPSDEAVLWLAKAGPEHYREHLPRLREWHEEIRGGAIE